MIVPMTVGTPSIVRFFASDAPHEVITVEQVVIVPKPIIAAKENIFLLNFLIFTLINNYLH